MMLATAETLEMAGAYADNFKIYDIQVYIPTSLLVSSMMDRIELMEHGTSDNELCKIYYKIVHVLKQESLIITDMVHGQNDIIMRGDLIALSDLQG